jgi:hypothetical protein
MDQGRSVYAMALSVLAFSIKATGSILTATLLVYLVVRALGESIRDRRIAWKLVGLSLAAGATLAGESLILRWSGAFEQQQGSRLPLLMAGIWFPDVLMLLGAIGVLAGVNLWGLGRQSSIWNVGVKILETGRDQPAAWCSVVVLAALAVAVSGVRFIPRYAALAVPLVYTILPGLAASAIGRGWMTGAMALITLLNLINWNGRLFPDGEAGLERIAHLPGIVLRREGSIRERSHEYLAIHQANLQAMHRACQEPEEIPIVTTEPYSCFLRFPALGVVKKPRAVYSFDPVGPVSLSNIASLADFERDRPTEVVVLRDTVVFNTVRAQAEVLPPQESDQVLFAETPELPTTLVVYRKRLDPSLGQSSEDWLRRARGKPFISAAMLWSAYSSRGAGSLYALAEQEATKTAWEPESSLVLAMSAARMGQWSLVVDHLLHAEARTMIGSDRRTYPANPLLPVRSNGLLRTLDAMLADARYEARTLALASCLEDAPFLRSGWGRYRLGLDLLEDGDPRTARGVFREVLRSIPTFWPAELGLIKVDIAESKSAEALRRLEELVAKHPDAIEPIVLLAQLHGKVGRSPPEVIQKLRDYLVQWPDSPGVREALQKSLGTDQPRAE